MTTTLALTTSDKNIVSRLTTSGWSSLRDAATLSDRVAELDTTVGAFIGQANELRGADRRAGYARIAQLANLVRELRVVGIDPLQFPASLNLDKLATILDGALLSQWHASKTHKGIPAADVWPHIAIILSDGLENISASIREINEYKATLVPVPKDESKGLDSEGDDDTETGAETVTVAPTPKDAIMAMKQVRAILESFDTVHVDMAKALVAELHALADIVADKPSA